MTDTTVKFRIPGTQQVDSSKLSWDPKLLKVSNVRTYTLATTRGESGEQPVEVAAAGDVVEVEMENGMRFWTTPQALRDEVFAELGIVRGADEVFEIPLQLPQAGGERGIASAVIKVLRFFTPDVSEFAAKKVAKTIEDRALEGGAGTRLYRCGTRNNDLELTAVGSADIPTNKTALLLLHGTGSSTRGSFGELWNDKGSDWPRRDSWLKLLQGYETVLALEHRTLTENPVQNLITLLNSLPAGMTLHVMSHSRGGMVGELLCRGCVENGQAPFSETELASFLKADPKKERGDLAALNQLLQQKNITVERFVRTACPARGTTLASGRLDIYLSALRALLSLIPGIVVEILDGFAELAAGIARERTDPSVLPGIEAMIPGSPLVKLLNNPAARVKGRLRVISGDIEGGTLASTFLTLLADPLFPDKHDLVVNTDSMYAGAQRSDGAAFVFYQGPEISHFRYFTNRPSVEKLERALNSKDTSGDGFTPYDIAKPVEPVVSRGGTRPRHTVFLLPGIMGSHLESQQERVWLNMPRLALGGMGRLRIGQAGIREEALVGESYNAMINSLSNAFNVQPFPYDWRLSVTGAAQRLANAIDAKLDELQPLGLPVSIVAHSMGGIVARAMIAYYPGTWKRLCLHKDARLVMLGTPTNGSHAMGMVLTGQDGLMRRLAMLDFQHDMKELLDIVREFPGVAELLPDELLDPAKWLELQHSSDKDGWSPPDADILKAAREVRNKIADIRLDGERVYYIAGSASATPCAVKLATEESGASRVVFDATPRGDGRVTWESGIPEKIRVWYAEALHGDLCAAEKCCNAVADILRSGDTTQLSRIAPSTRGLPDLFAMPRERAILHPDYQDLLASALCATPRRVSASSAPRIKVRVVHGSLEFAKYPILVGHYRGDTLVSAEADLDRHLGGRLRESHRLGLYPGKANTAQVFLNDRRHPSGAIVVGLGDVGKLAPGTLEAAVSRGIRTYATSLVDGQGKLLDARRGVSVLLVGTNGAGVSVSTAVAAILNGIDKALANLEKHHLGTRLVLEEVELIEIYQDRAIQAAHALWNAARDDTLAHRFEFAGTGQVACRRGARRRAYCEDTPDWWQRLVIREDECGELTFEVITDRARSENHAQSIQRKLVDQLVQDAVADPTPGNSAAATLFQMLTPNELKKYAPEQRNLVLMLNEATARYPWELMVENTSIRKGGSRDPAAVRGGMVRQLETNDSRPKVQHATEKSILIVGHPNLPPGKFAKLPAAVTEAREVEKKLTAYNYAVTASIETDAKTIMAALHAKEYLILHLSGHGVYRYEMESNPNPGCTKPRPLVSGMVIGDDLFLTPAEIGQMTTVPELAFINCCHLGRIEDVRPDSGAPNFPALAANLGAKLIEMGVRAVVAAGWAVNDDGARLFADAFYEAMLAGRNFGDAVLEARRAVYNAYPQYNTWGAYQCYGDPAYVLGNGGNHDTSETRGYRFVHPAEAVVALDNLAEEAATLQEYERGSSKTQVSVIHDALPPPWLEHGEILSALGRVWGELGEFQEAVKFYEKARKAENAGASLKAVEQLCNLRARRAVESSDPAEAEKLLKQSIADAEILLKISPTAERHIILGSVYKRQALVMARQICDGKSQNKAQLKKILENMHNCYADADEHYREANPNKVYPYPRLYSLASSILISMLDPKIPLPANLKAHIQEARTAGKERDRESPCFWEAIVSAEADLLQGLASYAKSPTHKSAGSTWIANVVDGYRQAQERDGSPRETRSVDEHLDFLATLAETAKANEAAAALREIREKIAR